MVKNRGKFLFVLILAFGVFSTCTGVVLAASPTMISQKATPGNTDVMFEGTINPNGYITTAWFEFGTAVNLLTPSETNHFVVGSGNQPSPVSTNVTDLVPDTTYYFRMVADNGQGTLKGSVLSFKTGAGAKPVSSETTTPTPGNETETENETPPITPTEEAEKPVAEKSEILKIEASPEEVRAGDDIEYFVTFTNITEETMENVQVRVELPEEIDFKESDAGKEKDNVISWNPGVLFSSESGSLKIRGKVNSEASGKSMLIATAVFSYNSPGSNSENKELASAATNVATGANNLPANSISSEESFLPSTLVDWLTLVLVLMAIVVVARMIYKGANLTPKDL